MGHFQYYVVRGVLSKEEASPTLLRRNRRRFLQAIICTASIVDYDNVIPDRGRSGQQRFKVRRRLRVYGTTPQQKYRGNK